MKKNVLVIGANGFTGRRILNDLSRNDKYAVTGCSLHEDIAPGSGNYHFITADISWMPEQSTLFRTVRPHVVINASALSVPDYCETHREEAESINVTAVGQLAFRCEASDARLIHISTDFVFSGEKGQLYTEEDTPNPVNYYGITKLKGEQRVAELCNNYAIARVEVVYGAALPGQHGNILQLVADRLRNNEQIRVVSDQWRTPTYVGDVSQGIEKLIEHPNIGIYHICGSENLSIADIAYRVADALNLESSLIFPVTTKLMRESTPRPRFSGMSIEKAKAELGYQPHTLEEGIKLMFNL